MVPPGALAFGPCGIPQSKPQPKGLVLGRSSSAGFLGGLQTGRRHVEGGGIGDSRLDVARVGTPSERDT